MSSVSSVGGNSLIQWLQQLTGNSQTTPTSTDVQNAAQNATQASDPFAPAGASGTPHHHHHGFAQKIESAVTTALQNAPSGSDPNQVIKDAITQALQKGKQGGSGGQDADGDNDGSTAAAGAAGSTGSTSATGSTSNGTSSSDAAFSQLLSSYGISPQQFQQDLQSALSSQNTLNFATLFRNFPPGSLLQATG